MKFLRFPHFLALPLLAFGLLHGACAQDLRAGTLKTVLGKVSVLRGDAIRAALSGGGVSATERIVTDPASSAVLLLRDGTVLTFGPNTTVDLARFQFDTTTQDGTLSVTILQGVVRVVTGLLGKLHPENVEVVTPSSTMGPRGTDFIVEVL